jgi:hypothetical protein
MKSLSFWVAALVISACSVTLGQTQRSTIPLGDAIEHALEESSLTYGDARPFHIRVSVTEPENPQSPYQGTVEEWWASATEWRREVTGKDGLHQAIVVSGGSKSEKDEGDYFPLWLRRFVNALIDPIPNANAYKTSKAVIEQLTFANGLQSDACLRSQSKIGIGDRATDAFSGICFEKNGRLKYFFSPRDGLQFHDYKPFGKKEIAWKYVEDPEPGTTLVGEVLVLEDLSNTATLFAPLPANDDRFQTAFANSEQMEKLTEGNAPVIWPSVRSGNTHGHLAMYISADSDGNVREAWPLNSDNAGLEDPAREQVRKWKLKPAVDAAGKRVQVDGGIAFIFDTKVENPLPTVRGAQIDEFSSGCGYNPNLPAGLLPSGTTFTIRVGVNEQGKLTGESFPPNVPWNVVQKAGLHTINCRFKPYIQNGKATYYAVEFVFTAP